MGFKIARTTCYGNFQKTDIFGQKTDIFRKIGRKLLKNWVKNFDEF